MKWTIKYEEPEDPKMRKEFREELERLIKNKSGGIRRKSNNVLVVDGTELFGSVVKFIVRLGGQPFFRKKDLVSFAGGKYETD